MITIEDQLYLIRAKRDELTKGRQKINAVVQREIDTWNAIERIILSHDSRITPKDKFEKIDP